MWMVLQSTLPVKGATQLFLSYHLTTQLQSTLPVKGATAPTRGAYWFERMKANHKDEILKGAAKVAGARGEKK